MPKVYFASDHAGFALKEVLKQHVQQLGHEIEDCGAHTLDTNDDYPDFVLPCAENVAKDKGSFGIVIGGSGQGEAMVANRVKGIRAAVFYGGSHELIRLTREHNDANTLSLGARFMPEAEAREVVQLFIETAFSGIERHKRRIEKF
jgi:ribose 5-phosphate isomerase B